MSSAAASASPLVAAVRPAAGASAGRGWPASVLIHIGYYVTLVGAYRHGELGFAYPIMRGTAPLLVALLSGRLIGEHLPAAAWLGIVGISTGVLLIGLTRSLEPGRSRTACARLRPGQRRRSSPPTPIVDGLGVRASGNALQYVALLFLVDGAPYFLIVMWQRRADSAGRPRLHAHGAGGSPCSARAPRSAPTALPSGR